MGLFNTPGPAVTNQELQRVFNTMRSRHSRLPHELFELWELTAAPYINEHMGQYRGMDAKELDNYMRDAEKITKKTYPNFLGYLPEFRKELEKAIKGTYGNILGI